MQLPTDRVGEPTRQGVIVDGRLDSNPPAAGPCDGKPSDPKASGGMELK